jgi:hypothetical protein
MQGIRFAILTVIGCWCGTAFGDVTIRGRVTDKSGAPVRGAAVFWLRPAPINSYPESIDGKVNEEGLFELTLNGHETPREVQREVILIYCEGYGLGTSTAGALSTTTADGKPVVILLPEESSTAFRVVDPDGHDLAGALVEPVIYVGGSAGRLPLSFVEAVGRVTNTVGIVEFPALENVKLRTVRVVSQAYGTQQLERQPVDGSFDQTIRLRRPGRVEVRFEASHGLSMRQCKMLAFTAPPAAGAGGFPGIPVNSLQGSFSEFFDDNRGFDIPAIAEGTLRFQLSGCRNDEPVLPHWPEKTDLKPGETKKFVVPFEKTATIHGRVLDYVTEKPCPNAEIYVYTRHAGCSFLIQADQEGRYRCNVLTGPACVSATRRDPVTRLSSGSSSLVERVVAADGLEFPDLLVNPRAR